MRGITIHKMQICVFDNLFKFARFENFKKFLWYLTKYKDSSFDAIIVTAAPPTVPEHLKKLLKVNGRLIIPVGDGLYQQELLKIIKHENGKFTEERLLAVRFVPMVKSWHI